MNIPLMEKILNNLFRLTKAWLTKKKTPCVILNRTQLLSNLKEKVFREMYFNLLRHF